VSEIVDRVHRPLVDALRSRGVPYRGVLYAGLMMTAEGPRVLEFNCRFGDPEIQAVLPRMRSDILELCEAACEPGGLTGVDPEFSDDWAVTLVIASAGYPASSSKDDVIRGLEEASGPGIELLHAATALRDGDFVTAGGRVLNVTGLGPDPGAARERAYDAAQRISFEGMQMRTDIAARAAERVAAG
jgi:phosphoribosylamine--glycine ligase